MTENKVDNYILEILLTYFLIHWVHKLNTNIIQNLHIIILVLLFIKSIQFVTKEHFISQEQEHFQYKLSISFYINIHVKKRQCQNAYQGGMP